MSILQLRFFCWLFPFSILFLFLFQFFIFLFFFNVKYGRTPLWIAAFKGDEQIVQILLEKGKANVDLPDQVLLLFVFFFFFFFFSFSFFYFVFNVKYGRTPLFMATWKGHEQIVQILLEKGKANVDLANKVIVLFVIILNLLILFFQSLQWKWRRGGVGGYWVIFVLCFIFLKILSFFLNLFSQVWVDPSS